MKSTRSWAPPPLMGNWELWKLAWMFLRTYWTVVPSAETERLLIHTLQNTYNRVQPQDQLSRGWQDDSPTQLSIDYPSRKTLRHFWLNHFFLHANMITPGFTKGTKGQLHFMPFSIESVGRKFIQHSHRTQTQLCLWLSLTNTTHFEKNHASERCWLVVKTKYIQNTWQANNSRETRACIL